jgi:copper transporter 1
MGCGMDAMCVSWSTSVPVVFFCWWRADTPQRFWWSTIAIFALAIAFELINNVRSRLIMHSQRSDAHPQPMADQLLLSAMHMLLVAYGLFLMMIFMTYNGLMMLALVAGHGCGHLLGAAFLPEAAGVTRIKSCCC